MSVNCNSLFHGVKPVRDFKYCYWDELEDDNRKIFHEIYYKGELVGAPEWFYNLGPYDYPTQEEFNQAVKELKLIMFAKGNL